MLDFLFARDALDLHRFYCDTEGAIYGLVAPAQDPESLAVIVQGGSANHERRLIQGADGEKVIRLIAFEREMRRALHDIGPQLENILDLCFRHVMSSSGTRGHEIISRSVFGIEGAAARRAIPLSAYYAHREIPARGPGNIAHLSPVLVEAFAASRSTLKISDWTDRLGRKLQGQGGQVSPAERSWGNQAPDQCEAMERVALKALRRERRHLPMRVRQAGIRLVR